MICPNCQYQNRPAARMCAHCGRPLPQAPPVKPRGGRQKTVAILGAAALVLLCALIAGGLVFFGPEVPPGTPMPSVPATSTAAPAPSDTPLPATTTATLAVAPATPTFTPSPVPTVAGPRRLDVSAPGRTVVSVTDVDANKSFLFFQDPGTISGMILSAAWSPDGNKVLLSFNWNSNIYDYGHIVRIVNADGTNPVDVVKTAPSIQGVNAAFAYRDAIWSPDGKRIAVRYQFGSDFGIWLVNADGTGLTRLESSDIGDWPRFWSVDGRWVIGVSSSDGILYAEGIDRNERVPFDRIKGIKMYDERYYPWRITADLQCAVSGEWFYTGGAYWDCQ